mmetsp:Transcript_8597/g.14567  ORF Transcript_8597/g.14567 Transcript_8597/m.14567 type:complete len:515 (-) Transcript_8597:283-1827(-)
MNQLLEITLRSRLVEKLCVAMYSGIFEEHADDDEEEDAEQRVLQESDHIAVVAVHAFLQNLYFYASNNHDEFRRHMLVDTLLIPRLILPYLNCCVYHARMLNERAEAFTEVLEGDDAIGNLALEHPNLVKGIAASIRTLIIASFRAPPTQYVMSLLRRLNPTHSMLKASSFCLRHDYIFALLCLLNVNMGGLDLSREFINDNNVVDAYRAHTLLHEMAALYSKMDNDRQTSVYKRVVQSGALPVCRDTASYVAVMSVLHGGAAGQLDYNSSHDQSNVNDEDEHWDSRAEAKKAHAERMELARQATEQAESKHEPEPKVSGFEVALQTANDIEERRLEAKESKSSGKDPSKPLTSNVAESKSDQQQIRGEGYRLLGDLPSLGGKKSGQDVQIAIELELPSAENSKMPMMKIGGHEVKASKGDSSLPQEFLCAINGHVMKDPVRCQKTGQVFEKATIEIWLSTRGQVCPITNEPLTVEELEADSDLRKKIMRYHIQQTSRPAVSTSSPSDDDLYDF